jgi:beta-fructofuranosidase
VRPILHYEPRCGWMNDPNGLIQWGGRHHLYYQHNPESTEFANQHWGHASSVDLLHWTEHPVALAPGGPEAPYDSSACFSGCAFVVDGRVAILYTGVEGADQLPCLAFAVGEDLLSFEKDDANPVIDKVPTPDITEMRDRSIWKEGSLWRQAMAGASLTTGASVFGFSSADLRDWSYDGVLVDAKGSGVPGPVWECPDVFRVDGVDVVIVSVIRAPDDPGPEVWSMVGALDGTGFLPLASAPLDLGDRLYAPQSYWTEDGRRLMFGWLRTHLDPSAQGGPSLGAMSLPRELSVDEGRLRVEPARELMTLRSQRADFELGAEDGTRVWVDDALAGELLLDFTSSAHVTEIRLIAGDGKLMDIDLTGFGASAGSLRLFWDAGIVEVFRNGRAAAWTDLRIRHVASIHLRHPPGSEGSGSIWELDPR